MDGAAADVEQVLTRAAGLPVLLDGVADRLLGEVVLEFERGDRQAVDEEPQVEGTFCFSSLLYRSWRVTEKRFWA